MFLETKYFVLKPEGNDKCYEPSSLTTIKPKTLRLTIKKKWFDMILSGEKKSEYREIKKHWNRRLYSCEINVSGDSTSYGDCQEIVDCRVVRTCPCHKCDWGTPKEFDFIEFINGYSPNSPRATFQYNGHMVGIGNTKLGAPEGKQVHIILLGKRVL